MNRAPAPGAFFAPDPPARGGQQAAGDGQPHSRSGGQLSGRAAPIEPLEQVVQFVRIQAWAVVGHGDVKAVGLYAGFNEDLAIGRRVLRRVLEQVGQCDRGHSRIDLDLGLLVGIHAQGMSVEGVANLRGGGVDDVGRRHPLRLEVNRGRVDAGHVQDVLEQSRQAIQFDERGTGLFLALLRLEVSVAGSRRRPESR